MNLKCTIRGHDWKTLKTLNLRPKPDGELKKDLDDFVVCDLADATYFADVRRCARCGKETVEIT